MTVLKDIAIPVIVAPMAGGPSTPELVAAADRAGGFGFLAWGTASTANVADQLSAMAGRRYGVNLFAPQEQLADTAVVAEVAMALDVPPTGEIDSTNGWAEKLAAVLDAAAAGHGPAVVSSTFGPMTRTEIDRLHEAGVEAWIGVSNPEDAQTAERLGADAAIVQGPEAGGHRFTWTVEEEPDERPLPQLLSDVREAEVRVPLVVAGGIGTPQQVRETLSLDGVAAVACGTAFLLADEAGTSRANRDLLARGGETVSTRAFSGRYARGLATPFTREHPDMPAIYPHLNPMLAPWRASGDEDMAYCLVGVGIDDIRTAPAGEILAWLGGPVPGG